MGSFPWNWKSFDYVEKNWIIRPTNFWPQEKWSVFIQPIRTNNNAEG